MFSHLIFYDWLSMVLIADFCRFFFSSGVRSSFLLLICWEIVINESFIKWFSVSIKMIILSFILLIWKSESVSCSVMSNFLRPMDCSPPGSSVHGILQARILEWAAIPFSRGSSLGIKPGFSCIAGRFFIIWTTKETQFNNHYINNKYWSIFEFQINLIFLR